MYAQSVPHPWEEEVMYAQSVPHPWEQEWCMRRVSLTHGEQVVYAQSVPLPHTRRWCMRRVSLSLIPTGGVCAECLPSYPRVVYAQSYPLT